MPTPLKVQRLHPLAYNALADALSVVYWYKKPLARFLRSALTGAPEALVQLDFDAPKRETVGRLVELLMADEARYQEITIGLMLSVAKMETFPDLARLEDRDERIAQAEAAVAEVRRWTAQHQEILVAHEDYARGIATAAREAERNRVFSADLARLKAQFLELDCLDDNGLPGGSATDAHTQLLLLLPAFSGNSVPDDGMRRLTAALPVINLLHEKDLVVVF
jgi:hypothetical protein